ncbi:glycosyltransferase family 4 protein [Sabulilitoribacter multivorans]|uniref:Glycosyltransferase family 4 protein n=1 Tax=Flaviramulus multivorans TaxID=1304750 RepID=A0ABS9IHR9_9FLAO|nr:glycosyltransferase family 4 protein [Flaviramulus multivorans]MCF7560304.1 glycosyltransferase family 4 protein [Flaviramulus multivorans]
MSSIDVLAPLLSETNFKVISASHKKSIIIRLLHMLYTCFKYRKKADYVLIDTYSTLNFYYAFFVSQLCRILKLKYIPLLHGGNLPERLKTSPVLSKAIFNNAHINVAPSIFIKRKFEEFAVLNVINIPNSIELAKYPFKQRNYSKVKLLWVRSFSKIYNPLLAIRVLKMLKDDNLEAELCMVGPDGDGSFLEARELAKQSKVDVTFTGKLSKKEWISLSTNYNFFINTTNFDNMPVSVIEAMALGLPVISTNVGGMPFLIENGKEGVLIEPNSVESFVDAIKELHSTPDKANQIALSARKRVENFDWNIVKNQWIKLLQ